MSVKIHPDIQYFDPVTRRHCAGVLDMDAIRALITRQSSGSVPSAVGFEEIAKGMERAEGTARRVLRQLSLSFRDVLPVNSCYKVSWFDPTNCELIRPAMFETDVPRGSLPVVFGDLKLGNARYEHGKKELASLYGQRGGRGNRKISGTVLTDTD